MEIELNRETIEKNVPLIVLVIIAAVLLYASLNTTMLGEDEGFYYNNINRIINLDLNPFTVTGQQSIFVPMIPAIIAPLFMVFGQSLSLAKLVIAMFAIGTLIVVYLINKKYGTIAAVSSMIVLLSTTLFTHYSLLLYTDVPIAFFSILSVYLFLSLDSYKKAALTAVVLSAAFYTKQTGLFIAAMLFVYGLYKYFYEKDKKYFKLAIITLVIFAITIVPWLAYNLITYNYPNVEGLNVFFKQPGLPDWLAEAQSSITPNINFINILGPLVLLLTAFGVTSVFIYKEKTLYLPLVLVLLFLLVFFARMATGVIGEDRYFIAILPEVALFSGYFLQKLYDKDKRIVIVIAVLLVFLFYMGASIAISTSSTQRYPTDYINAMTWLKDNTPKDSIVFTAYEGSMAYYAQRPVLWSKIEEFPQIMTTTDPSYIHDTLKDKNVSYILLWSGILADRYIIPESNLYGVFTYNFLNTVLNDTADFNTTYQNQNSIIFKVV